MPKMLESAWCLKCTLLCCVHVVSLIPFIWDMSLHNGGSLDCNLGCGKVQWCTQYHVTIWTVKTTSEAAGSYENIVDSLHDYRVPQCKFHNLEIVSLNW